MRPEGAPPPKGAVPPPRQVGGGTMWAGCRESGPVAPRAPWNGGGTEPVTRRGRARRQSKSDPTTHAAMNGSAAAKQQRASP